MPNGNYNIDFILVRTMAEAFAEETFDCEKVRGLMNTTTDETQNEHRLALNDHLWRLQDKIGKLWMYVSGSADFETLLNDQIKHEKEELEKRQTAAKVEEVAEKVEEIKMTE